MWTWQLLFKSVVLSIFTLCSELQCSTNLKECITYTFRVTELVQVDGEVIWRVEMCRLCWKVWGTLAHQKHRKENGARICLGQWKLRNLKNGLIPKTFQQNWHVFFHCNTLTSAWTNSVTLKIRQYILLTQWSVCVCVCERGGGGERGHSMM